MGSWCERKDMEDNIRSRMQAYFTYVLGDTFYYFLHSVRTIVHALARKLVSLSV